MTFIKLMNLNKLARPSSACGLTPHWHLRRPRTPPTSSIIAHSRKNKNVRSPSEQGCTLVNDYSWTDCCVWHFRDRISTTEIRNATTRRSSVSPSVDGLAVMGWLYGPPFPRPDTDRRFLLGVFKYTMYASLFPSSLPELSARTVAAAEQGTP